MPSTKTYPKGSEWRKWDLHIHTPKSIIQHYGGDNSTTWDIFIAKLAALPPEIKVIGITDYLFCDGYEYLSSRREEIPNIDLIIPNIEFRLNTFSGTVNNSQRHNFHVLFDPSVGVQIIRDQFLNCLSSGYKITDNTEWQQTPTKQSLEELGKQIKAEAPAGNSIHSKSDLEVGFINITYKIEDILKLLKKSCFKGKYIIAIGYSEWDQSRWDQSAAEKRTLINISQFSLTCLDDPYKISENVSDLKTNNLNSLILHSSDAHEIDRIGQTMLWVKADPTFAGFKQVMNEPESRVFIGATPPNLKPDHKVITKIKIPSSKGWFSDDFEIDLNRDLVTIIGGRGSGKSALAEAIAYGSGSKDNSEDAFLQKAVNHKDQITGTRIIVQWGDGQLTENAVGSLEEDQGLVRYLPQGAVEELCSPQNSEKLQEQIENVIYQAIDDTEKMGSSDFNELKTHILADFQFEKEQIAEKVRDVNHKISYIISLIKSLPEKEKLRTEKATELDRLNKSLPALPSIDKKGQDELANLVNEKKIYDDVIVDFRAKYKYIQEIESKIKVFKTKIDDFKSEIMALLGNLGLPYNILFDVTINEAGISKYLDDMKREITVSVNILKEGDKKNVADILKREMDKMLCDNLLTLNKAIEDKQKETKAFETTKLKYQQQKKAASTIESTIKALESEINKIKTEYIPDKVRLEKERIDTYCQYFEILKNEKKQIELLYKPLQESLLAGSETDNKLVFEAQIKYRLDPHYKSGLDIIDRTRKGSFREIKSLKKELGEAYLDYARHEYERTSIERYFVVLLNKFTSYEGAIINIEEQLRDEYTIEQFYNWLFDPTYYEIVSSLKFDDTDLYVLSPGQKGIILLMLYLEIDKEDYRPLIIDQPEENLDSFSVYKDLIKYFRDRKQYRQIIMVTHNPNLVVNTDAEQIIIANYNGKRSPRLEYCSGSLEDQARKIPDIEIEKYEDGIIEQVCNILEGGEPAFKKRKDKYGISCRSNI